MNDDNHHPRPMHAPVTRNQAEDCLYRLRRTSNALSAVGNILLISGVELRSIEGVSNEEFAALLELLADTITNDVRPLERMATTLPWQHNHVKGMQ